MHSSISERRNMGRVFGYFCRIIISRLSNSVKVKNQYKQTFSRNKVNYNDGH